ncbi:phosphopantetheine-binding protein [Actinoallomurus purpureus]|uniref:acyl carrier protein n=1 Tax=Actinoallomurus purpureus TaxID=478114 RepID=UPI002092E315|nr:phosphopantetheine-binding protein [Actinoallomurus purpureus]MCO6007350.1 phosphopantetheine-binding protein [Actinoallomurus purpureus]
MGDRRLSRDEVRAVLVTAVREVRPALTGTSITGDEHLVGELGIDSVERVELLIALEEALEVEDEVDPRVFMIPMTINDLVDQIVVAEPAVRE